MTNYNNNKEQWIASVVASLVIDQQARNYKKMKNSIWLFLYLLLHFNGTQALVSKKIDSICSDMGIKRDTVIRWLSILKKQGYIATQNTGRDLLIRIKVWNSSSPDMAKNTHQKLDISNFCPRKNPTPKVGFKRQNKLNSKEKTADPIDISINNNILKIDINKENITGSTLKSQKAKNKEELLAYDMAQELDDFKGLPFYLSCSKKYSEQFLREVLSQVKQIPSRNIKKSRAALFNHLTQKHAQQTL